MPRPASCAARRLVFVAVALIGLVARGSFAQSPGLREKAVEPGAGLEVSGVPAVPAALASSIERYRELRGPFLFGWHPVRREALVSQRGAINTQVFRIAAPGAPAEQLTDYPDPIWNAAYPVRGGDYFVFTRDEGGNERYRLHRWDFATRSAVALSPADRRTWAPTWAHRRGRVYYLAMSAASQAASEPIVTEIRAVDADAPQTDRVVATLPGAGWTLGDVTRDERAVTLVEWIAETETRLWVVDLASGARREVKPAGARGAARYSLPSFDRSGRALVTSSDHGSEFRRLLAIDVVSGRTRLLAAHPWDVTWYAVSPDGRRVAYVTNEDGFGVLHLVDVGTGRRVPLPATPNGSVGNAQWHPDGRLLGFTLSSATDAQSIHAIDVPARRIERWSAPDPATVALGPYVREEVVRWPSFDGRMIPGFLFRPPAARFPGRRPVMIELHGGPESQWRPGFIGSANYWLNELGVALVFPNVRGSTGYGKTFVALDDGRKREDAVRDVEALLDWIGRTEGLDASRVLLTGSSYGGYLTLATAARSGERIACAASDVGITSFVSFLEKTEGWRRDLRRVEYGDERDPATRAFLESISPLANAHRVRRPLLISHGANDPRVPVGEALRFAETVRRNDVPVWTVVARDEGHGFSLKENVDFLFYATVLFARRCLGLDDGARSGR